jgi:transcriptional regulator with XRE-family HTH domain
MLSLKTDGEWLESLAEKCRTLRLLQNMSQQEVSDRAGIALRTYRRFEQEGQISLERFVAVMRALNRLPELEGLLKPPPVMDLRELDQKEPDRKRAGRKS